MTCSFNNVNCMCQFCEKQCNNGFNCYECNHEGKVIHDIYIYICALALREIWMLTYRVACAFQKEND